MSSLSFSFSFSFSFSIPFSFFRASRNQEEEENQDLLISQPKDILQHIFSFVPTKDTVATSALSRQWRDFWRPPSPQVLLPHLDFNDVVSLRQPTPNDRTLFINFVNNVLRSFNLAGVSRVTFSCLEQYGSACINRWLREACMHGNIVELQLFINFDERHPIELPPEIVTSSSLVVLKLNAGVQIDLDLRYDGITIFPSLKILHIFVHNQQDLDLTTRLYSRCPVLEDLFLESLMLPEEFEDQRQVKFEVCSATLKRLRIEFTLADGFTDIYCYSVVIKAKNLEWLDVSNNFIVAYTLEDLDDHHVLDQANVSFGLPSSRQDADLEFGAQYDYQVFLFVKQLSHHVKCLSLSGGAIWVLRFAIEKILYSEEHPDEENLQGNIRVPQFTCLTTLELGFRSLLSWNVLPFILEWSPNLEFLALEKEVLDGDVGFYTWLCIDPRRPVPMCMLQCLKQIGIKGFQGKLYELRVVEFFLRQALVLEKMIICAPPMPAGQETMLREYLLGYATGSGTCQVFFFIDDSLEP